MKTSKSIVLNTKQIEQKINRIAYEIYENNYDEKEIILAGIMPNGFKLAERVALAIKKISNLDVGLFPLLLDKKNPLKSSIPFNETDIKNKSIVLVDDVLNSGKTLIYAVKCFLDADIKKIKTVVLVDRSHTRYPIKADFVGISLSTTMQEHVTVDLNDKGESVAYLN